MGGGDLNTKKSWHPSTMKNQEKVWKAEQQRAQEDRKMADLRKEMDEEKCREELTQYGRGTGVLAAAGDKADKKLDWMYKEPSASSVDREQYLLGKAIDRTFEKIAETEKALAAAPKNHVEHECIPFSMRSYRDDGDAAAHVQVDMARKMLEDPLVAIRKREVESRTQLLQNPVKLKELSMLLKAEQLQRKQRKEKKKNKKDKLAAMIREKLARLGGDDAGLKIDDILSGKGSKNKRSKKKKKKRDSSESDSDDPKRDGRKKKKAAVESSDSSSDGDSDDKKRRKSKKHDKKRSSRSSFDDKHRSDRKRSYDDRKLSDDFKRKSKKQRKQESSSDSDSDSSDDKINEKRRSVPDGRSKHGDRRSPSPKDTKYRKDAHRNKESDSRNHSYQSNERDSNRRRKSRSPDRSEKASKQSAHRRDERESKIYDSIDGDKRYGLLRADGSKIEIESSKATHAEDSSSKSKGRVEATKKGKVETTKKRVVVRMTDEEKEAKRREMMANAVVRDRERAQNVKYYRKLDKNEELKNKSGDYREDFVERQLLAAASQSSVESRIKSNIYNIQRSSAHMDSNFARR